MPTASGYGARAISDCRRFRNIAIRPVQRRFRHGGPMRTSNAWLCDTPAEPGCEKKAAVAFTCTVEGREIALCRSCNAVWRRVASQRSELSIRCPLCAPVFLSKQEAVVSDRIAQAHRERQRVRITSDAPMLTGPVADVFDSAMAAEGVLIDVRHRVLARLYSLSQDDSSGYVAALLRSTSTVTEVPA